MTDDNTGPAGLPPTVTYEPLPSIYRAFAAGATPYAIITETIDNSIDFVRGQALKEEYYPTTLEVDIRFDLFEEKEDTDEDGEESSTSLAGRLIITDNAGGVPPEDLAKFFQLGHSDAPPEGIGRFGVGAKRLIGIGNHIRYESHAHGHDIAAGFEVDAQKLQGEATTDTRTAYTSDVYEAEGLEEGQTRIVVEDLKKGVWERLCGATDGKIDEDAEDSLWRLEETYEHFLRDDIKIDPSGEQTTDSIEFGLSWGVKEAEEGDTEKSKDPRLSIDEDVSAPDRVDLSYIPFDGLWPRKYEGMPFANDSETPVEECLRVDIEVGLLPSSVPEKAGLTVTMNNRNVLFRDTQNDLFSSNYLGNFRSSEGHGRLHCIVSIHGEAADMPWSDTKDALDGTQQVTGEILNVAENALKEYRRQTYRNLPRWILSAYSVAQLKQRGYYSVDGIRKHPEYIDKSNSKVNSPRFNQKPGERVSYSSYRQFPVRDKLVRTAYLHGALRIRCDDSFEEIAQPAYLNYFEAEYEGPQLTEVDESNLPDVEDYEVPLRSDKEDTIPLIEDLKNLASEHAEEEKRLTSETVGAPVWLLLRYEEELQDELGDEDAGELQVIESFDLSEWRRHNSISEDVRVDEEPAEGQLEESESGPRQNQPRDVQRQPGSSQPDQRQRSRPSGTSAPRSSSTGQGASDTEVTSTPTSQEAEIRRQQPETTTGADQATFEDVVQTPPEPSEPTFYFNNDSYELGEEDVSLLLDTLGLEDDSDPAEIIQAIVDALESREKMAGQLRELSKYVNIEGLLGEPVAVDLDNNE